MRTYDISNMATVEPVYDASRRATTVVVRVPVAKLRDFVDAQGMITPQDEAVIAIDVPDHNIGKASVI